MGLIADTIETYEELRKHIYTVKIKNGLVFSFRFRPENYHHIAGFQHLVDLPDIADPPLGHRWFYTQAIRGRLNEEAIGSSRFFSRIQDRLRSLEKISDILFQSNKIIVRFDRNKARSDIVADFFLYKRDGNMLTGPYTIYHLFLGHDAAKDTYFPATYIVETTKQYISGQEMLDCEIIIE